MPGRDWKGIPANGQTLAAYLARLRQRNDQLPALVRWLCPLDYYCKNCSIDKTYTYFQVDEVWNSLLTETPLSLLKPLSPFNRSFSTKLQHGISRGDACGF